MFNNRKKVYVAGHKGLLGSAIVRRLNKIGGAEIITATHTELDLTDSAAVNEFFHRTKPDYVLLAAARVGGIQANINFPASFIEDNLSIQINVLRAARKMDIARVIYFGSSCMYPKNGSQPLKEETLLSGHPEITSLPYSMAKLAGLYQCLAYNKQENNTRFVPVIPNTLYGPHDNFDFNSGHVLPALITRFHQAKNTGQEKVTLWGSGSPIREFVHADDVADACIFLLQANLVESYLPMNIGTGIGISIRDLARIIADIVGYKGEIEWDRSKPDGTPVKVLDNSKITSMGWKAAIGLEQGIIDTYRWFQSAANSEENVKAKVGIM